MTKRYVDSRTQWERAMSRRAREGARLVSWPLRPGSATKTTPVTVRRHGQ